MRDRSREWDRVRLIEDQFENDQVFVPIIFFLLKSLTGLKASFLSLLSLLHVANFPRGYCAFDDNLCIKASFLKPWDNLLYSFQTADQSLMFETLYALIEGFCKTNHTPRQKIVETPFSRGMFL